MTTCDTCRPMGRCLAPTHCVHEKRRRRIELLARRLARQANPGRIDIDQVTYFGVPSRVILPGPYEGFVLSGTPCEPLWRFFVPQAEELLKELDDAS